jgi:hypothetical protein
MNNIDEAQRAVSQHFDLGRWLQEAESYLADNAGAVTLYSFNALGGFRAPTFTVEVPRDIWAPQLQQEINEVRARLTALDEAFRVYLAASKGGLL